MMEISKESLEMRLAELRQTLSQLQANGNATIGAISECEYWLKQLESQEANSEKVCDQ